MTLAPCSAHPAQPNKNKDLGLFKPRFGGAFLLFDYKYNTRYSTVNETYTEKDFPVSKSNNVIAVYEIRNTISGKFYIGSSGNLYERWRTHRTKLRKRTHPNPKLQSSWSKHGESAFAFVKLAEFDCTVAMGIAEEALINELFEDPLCCNLSRWFDSPMRGRTGEESPNYGGRLSEQQKQVIREATIEQWKTSDPRTGRKHSDETKEKIRTKVHAALAEGRGGRFIPTEETRQKMSEGLKGNTNALGHVRSAEERQAIAERVTGNQNWLGKSHSEESKAKMGQSVKAIAPDGTETVYSRTTAIKEELGIFLPTVQRSVRSGKALSRGPYKGWRFEYV